MIDLRLGDCRDVMKELVDCSIDSVGTDPPYELGFMGKAWDASGIAYDPMVWTEVLRVLKPGGYLLAFGGSRTYHRMACAIEDAGFIVHPMIAWCQAQGFPKAVSLSKAFDKDNGAEREVIGKNPNVQWSWLSNSISYNVNSGSDNITAPASSEAIQ